MYFWEGVYFSVEKGGAKSSKQKVSSNFEKKVGRPNSLTDDLRYKVLKAYYSHPYSLRQLADMFGVSRMTVWRTVQGSSPTEVLTFG
ncbi:helix-turn-helix domain-containing protein [Candidatus Micrarchaeota archaeon]|nr:helix-turn-helix domain-containing protein [Candidatus Micrarchaeota archaeon]